MSTLLLFLAEWAVRSALLVLVAALLLEALRVQDPAFRLASWTAVLLGSLLIPALTPAVPGLKLPLWRTPQYSPQIPAAPPAIPGVLSAPSHSPRTQTADPAPARWTLAVLLAYLLGAATLLVRLFTGQVLSRRLIARSRPTGQCLRSGPPIHESNDLATPATLGVLRPAVVLPIDWREWEPSRLQAILAHEQSHISRHDPALQCLSAIHRALLWFSPSSWFLHRQMVRVAEEASDDAALAAAGDRASYAEALLHFIQRAVEPVRWEGVAMARYGNPDRRIHRILDGTSISRGMTRPGWVLILAVASPMFYLAAAARPASATAIASDSSYAPSVTVSSHGEPEAASAAPGPDDPDAPTAPPNPEQDGPINRYLIVTGDSSSGTWDSRDHLPIDSWRSQFGPDFVWFREDGRNYIVTDERVLEELYNAMAPQREVNRMQSEVNRQQSDVNAMQSEVNRHQAEINRRQSEVNRQQHAVNDRQRDGFTDHAGQSRTNAMQAAVNDQQNVINREQEKVNAQQSLVNEEQRKVNVEQRRVSPGIEIAIQQILRSTLSNGAARPISMR